MKANKPNYTIDELRQHFVYDSTTGILTWSDHHSNRKKNQVAGRIDSALSGLCTMAGILNILLII